MKKLLSLCAIVFTTIAFIGCSKSTTTTPTSCAECEGILANASEDASQKGCYKGIAVAPEGIGHFKFFYENGNPKTYMILKYTRNGYPTLIDSLVPTGSIAFNPSGVTNIPILGSVAKNAAYMETPPASSSLTDFTLSGGIGTGPKPQAAMVKETSTEEVKVFEGTMTLTGSTAEAGKIAFLVKGTTAYSGIITSATNTLRERFSGNDITNGFKIVYSSTNTVIEGKLLDNTISGTITIGGSAYGAFSATRSF